MPITITHAFTSLKSDGTDATLVRPSNWNANHVIVATAAASAVIFNRAGVPDGDSGLIYDSVNAGLIFGGSAGFEISSFSALPQYVLIRPVAASGSLHVFFMTGDSAHSAELFLVCDNDPTLVNAGHLNMGVKANTGTAYIQSAVTGTGTPITVHNFGEFTGQSSLLSWNVQFGGVTKFAVTPTAASAPSLITTACTVATLPAAPVAGQRAFVTDSDAASFTAGIGAIVAAGGSTHVPVIYDGTNWRIG